MLTSPVFTLLVARGVFHTSYPSFARTLRQTRDLTVWLLITLGAVRVGERQQLLRAPRPATNRPLDCLPLLLGSSSVSTPLLTRVLSSNPVPTLTPNPDPHQVSPSPS